MSLSKYTNTLIIYTYNTVNVVGYSGKGAKYLNYIINTSLYLGK